MARGPAYPFISLGSAVALAQKIYDFSKRSPANLNAVLKEKLGYSPTSSSAVKVVAALKYYGLIDVAGSGESEILKISDRAYRVLLDSPSAPERKKALRDACLAPKAYKLCWDLWGTEMPPSMRSTLLFEHGFIDSSVDAFIKNYKASLQFSGLLDEKNGLEEEEEPEINHQNEVSSASVQSQDGALPSVMPQNAAPAQGIEAAPSAPTIERPLLTKGAGMRQEIFTVSEGDVTIQWPERMSADSLQDFKDWLRILERKITRSSLPPQSSTQRTVDEPPLG